jgi:hypothetical protein
MRTFTFFVDNVPQAVEKRARISPYYAAKSSQVFELFSFSTVGAFTLSFDLGGACYGWLAVPLAL